MAVSSLGMTLGPGLSSVLEFIPNGYFLGMTVTSYNILSLVMCISWILITFIFFFKFKGHDAKKGSDEKLK